MVWRLASGRRIFRRHTVWPPYYAPGRSGLTATTSSTRPFHLADTNSPVGDERWGKTFSISIRRPSRYALVCDQVNRLREWWDGGHARPANQTTAMSN